MLFDLRGRHRRRLVKVIYIGLALLIGVGLVGFGIGSFGSGGGIVSSLTSNEGSSSTSFAKEVTKYKKLVAEQPRNATYWEQLASAQLHEAGSEAYVTSSGAVTSKGKQLFKELSQSWNSYVALDPVKANPELAQRMLTVYGEQGLNEPAAEVGVLQIVVAARPTDFAYFAQLAEYAYKAKDAEIADLAAAKAVSLAPAADKAKLKKELAEIKKASTTSSKSSVVKK
jgi:hypothetical protein